MDKLKLLKKQIATIICRNQYVVSHLETALKQRTIEIKISGMESCSCNYDDFNDEYNIEYGCKYISELYGYCMGMYSKLKLKCNSFEEITSDDISLYPFYNRIKFADDNCSPTASDVLSFSHFLDSKHEKINNLTIAALIYAIYHEIGHIVHNKETFLEIDKEIAADLFAFRAAKELCSFHCREEDDIIMFGMFLSLSHMLLIRTFEDEAKDTSHPYSIKRISNFFNEWKLTEQSCYWELAHSVVMKWCEINNQPVTWERDLSFRDRFMVDLYNLCNILDTIKYATTTT
jgi:hypothetical protein